MVGRERAREKTKKGREGWTQGGREEEEEGGKLIHKDTENV